MSFRLIRTMRDVIASMCCSGVRNASYLVFSDVISYFASLCLLMVNSSAVISCFACMHCGTTLVASGGSTSSMLLHLNKKHPGMLAMPNGAGSLDR